MITLARESRGLTQKELADLLSISPAKLCKVEQEDQSMNDDIIEKMSEALRYPKTFFAQEGEAFLPMSMNFRKRVKVAQKLLMPIEAQINIHRMHVEILAEKLKIPDAKFPVLDIREYGSPAEVAKQLRKMWKTPKGSIENILELLESKGIFVLTFDFGTERVDSRTILTKDKHPVIILNKTLLGDRQRFSLAFELGHLVMHAFTMPSMDIDINHEANLFAAEFLMPESDIKKDLEAEITIPRLAELKRKWRISMQALLYRAMDLNTITYNQKRYLLGQFNTLKIIRREPPELDVPKEKPRLLRDLITKYRSAYKVSLKDLSATFCLNQEEFMELYSN